MAELEAARKRLQKTTEERTALEHNLRRAVDKTYLPSYNEIDDAGSSAHLATVQSALNERITRKEFTEMLDVANSKDDMELRVWLCVD